MPDDRHVLVDLVRVATEQEKSERGRPAPPSSTFSAYVIFVGVAALGFAIMGFLLVRARRKAAKLAYELRKNTEERCRVLEDLHLSESLEKREAAQERSQQLEEEIEGLKKEIKRHKAAANERVKAVMEAASWEDLGL